MSYVDPSDPVPLFAPVVPGGGLELGRLTAFDSTTMANTVVVKSQARVNIPVLAAAVATLSAPCTVVLAPLGAGQVIIGKIRVP